MNFQQNSDLVTLNIHVIYIVLFSKGVGGLGIVHAYNLLNANSVNLVVWCLLK